MKKVCFSSALTLKCTANNSLEEITKKSKQKGADSFRLMNKQKAINKNVITVKEDKINKKIKEFKHNRNQKVIDDPHGRFLVYCYV